MNITDLEHTYPDLKKILDTITIVDVGNTFTKTEDGLVIPSTVTEMQDDFEDLNDATATIVEWNGKKYIVGDRKGSLNMQPDKFNTDHYKVSLLNAIALKYEETGQRNLEVRLGLGLPAKFYVKYNKELKDVIEKLQTQTIKVDNQIYNINIKEVQVFKQGGTLSVDRKGQFKYPLMVLDFGGGTLDISYWEEQRSRRKTKVLYLTDTRSFTEFGVELVMSEFATKCNAIPEGDGKYTVRDVITFLEEGNVPFGDENMFKELKDSTFGPYCNNVVAKINTELNPSSCKDIRVIGGAGDTLIEYLKPLFPKENISLIDDIDNQCVNAQLFYERYKEILAVEYLESHKNQNSSIKEVAVTKNTDKKGK